MKLTQNHNRCLTTLTTLPTDINELVLASESEGYRFVARLKDEWLSGKNRFSEQNESLMIARDSGVLVAIGGINNDPYLSDPDLTDLGLKISQVGRLRHVYVRPEWRRSGVGCQLVRCLIESSRADYKIIRLSVADNIGGLFYESLGFTCVTEDTASHSLAL